MDDELQRLGDIVQATFGLPITITRTDGETVEASGIFSTELMESGQVEGMVEQVTVISVDASLTLNRGDRIGDKWLVDRKLKEDGYLATWNLYEQ